MTYKQSSLEIEAISTSNVPNRSLFIEADNLDVMRGINSNCIDLIYLDPPFNSNKQYNAPIGDGRGGQVMASFKDSWTMDDVKEEWVGLIADQYPALSQTVFAAGASAGRPTQAYLTMMSIRLLEMHRILKPTGSIYLHCDPTESHYLKAVMDSIFGRQNFINEVVWYYRGAGIPRTAYSRRHDILLWYAKSAGQHYFNPDPIRQEYAQATTERFQHHIGNVRGNRDYGVQTLNPKGKHPDDVITHIQPIAPSAKERLGYPTQKPLILLEHIIKASSEEGDLVLDPFCGCATACVAAESLNRRWIGIDLSPLAENLIHRRFFAQGVSGEAYTPEQPTFPGLTKGDIITRRDIPTRTTDLAPIPRDIKHVLYGKQEGNCLGCDWHFPFHALTIDHIVAISVGGPDVAENMQLLCGSCNSKKGNRLDLARLRAQNRRDGILNPNREV